MFACVIEASSGEMWKEKNGMVDLNNVKHATATDCTHQMATADIYIRFVFILLNNCSSFSSSCSVSHSRTFNNSQTEQVRIGSAGGVPADNIFIQAVKTKGIT